MGLLTYLLQVNDVIAPSTVYNDDIMLYSTVYNEWSHTFRCLPRLLAAAEEGAWQDYFGSGGPFGLQGEGVQ